MKLKKIILICMCTSIFIGNIFVLLENPTISGDIDVLVDFSTDADGVFKQTCNAANIWDISQLPENMTDYKESNPTIDTFVLMTATGGRSTGSNDYVYRYGNGTLYYDFTNLTAALDKVIAGGMHLELVIGNVPHALANQTSFDPEDYGAFDALTLPPGNMSEYYWYISNLTSTCLARYGMGNVSTWEWRLMTEPDNAAWWTAGVDAYIDLWMNTTAAIKQFVPNASLVLGNMELHDDFSFMMAVLQEIKSRDPQLLPDTVSFSYYHSLRHPEAMDDLQNLIAQWNLQVDSLDLNKNISITCEEGFILTDENGRRLWAGDGTELGAAWEAWMITSSVGGNFRRFAQWLLEIRGYLSPRGFVHLMAEEMDGMDIVDVHAGFAPGSTKFIDGIAVKNDSSHEYDLMLYQYFPVRDPNINVDVHVNVAGLPSGDYTATVYRIDKHNHNWFTKWSEDVKSIEGNATLIKDDASPFDLYVETRFNHYDAYVFWYNWRQANPYPTRTLVASTSSPLSVGASGRQTLNLEMNSNCVIFVKISPD
ncbi:MAG: GH39 family glycosyl hydrolase [Promethearchaeota archaeon]